MSLVTQRLQDLLRPVITTMGYELVGVEYQPRAGGALVRVYIDSEDGIGLDDCQQVSHQVSGLFDVEDPIPDAYTLEVSSPGLDRPLFAPEHYERFSGETVNIRLTSAVAGRRKFTGLLIGLQGADVVVEVDGEKVSVPFERIEKARLVPQF